jgi:hypothetical protein
MGPAVIADLLERKKKERKTVELQAAEVFTPCRDVAGITFKVYAHF